MPRGEDPHTVVIDQDDLQPTIQSNGREDVIHNLDHRHTEKSPRLEGNYSFTEKSPRLEGNIASDNKDDDLVEVDNLMTKWEEILKAGYSFDKGKHLKYLNFKYLQVTFYF